MAAPETIIQTDNVASVTPGRIEGGSFGVSHDGAATYALPLWVPVGRRGVQPELALKYHSRGGNGLLGVGWALSGIPRIARAKKTIGYDGFDGPVRFDQNDAVTLDGERLVLVSGSYGVDNSEYRTTRDGFSRIILHDSDALGATWFEVFYKDGRVLRFGGVGGGDLGSRFEGTAQQFDGLPGAASSPTNQQVQIATAQVRFAWSLQSISDRSGNTLAVHYNRYLPSQI